MLLKLSITASLALALTVFASACGGPPKQAEVVDDTKETGMDVTGQEPSGEQKPAEGEPAAAGANAEEMHTKCCGLCKEGLASDRTGAEPSSIPCSDFTSTLTPWCLEHFRSKPTMASECK